MEPRLMKVFGKDVCKLSYAWDKLNTMWAGENALPYDMIIQLSMFSAGMKNWIWSNLSSAKIIRK